MKTLWQDIRFGVRMLRKNPGFTAVAVLSLALGIGANAAIFQLLNAVRLRSLPVRSPHELAEIRIPDMTGARGSFSSRYNSVTNPIWEQIRDRQQSFSGVFAWGQQTFNLSQGGEVRPAKTLWVSGEFFNTLGVTPVAGRLFNSADDTRGCSSPGVVISHPFWQREYGGDRGVIGRKLTLARFPFEIIGVTPEGFFGMEVGQSFDLALPICAEALVAGKNNRLDSATNWWLMVTGRLKPGVSLEQATSELQNMSPSLFQTTLAPNYPPVSVKNYLDMKLEAAEIAGGYSGVRENYQRSLWLLLAIGGLVLLIACANLANLLLARATAREREMAVRQALGASRGKLVRQLLAESLLLAAMGALLGVLLAQFLSQFLVSFISTTNDKIFLDLALDWRVLGFTALVATLTCILFGLMPALRATRIEPGAAMKASGRGLSGSGGKFNLRRALVVVQVALSLVLVASAILFSRSLNKLLNVDAGFRSEGILISGVGLRQLDLPPERRVIFKRDLLERIKAIPGVESAAETNLIPLSGAAAGNNVWQEGADAKSALSSSFSWIGPDYFKTLNTPLVAGREITEHDSLNAPKVAVVNETFARRLFNDPNPVGRRFWIEETPTDPETAYEVVGVVKDTKYVDLREEANPIAFLALAQQSTPAPSGQFLIRSRLPRAEISAAMIRTLAEINPAINVNFLGFKTMIEESLLRERLMATLSGFFGLLALLLASIGLYGILSYGVASRTKEIGIRMALGAQPREVRVSVLRESLVLVLIGVAVGLPIVFFATRFANTLLFGLTPTDPVSLGLAGLLLCVVAFVAGYMPARRATQVDPLVALRYE